MKLAGVIPLSKKVRVELLTYFTQKQIALGDIVMIPVRKKNVRGLVVSIEDVSTEKTSLKNLEYELRKVNDVVGPSGFPKALLVAFDRAKDYFVTTTGTLIDLCIPEPVFTYFAEKKSDKKNKIEIKNKKENEKTIPEKLAYQAPFDERISYYKTLVRTAFAQKKSIALAVPTHAAANYLCTLLGKGINDHVICFTGIESKRELAKKTGDAISREHPVLIIGTLPWCFIPRNDFSHFIIEEESNDSYRTIGDASIDLRILLELFAEESRIPALYAGTVLRVETHYRLSTRELNEVAPISMRLQKTAEEQWLVLPKDKSMTTDALDALVNMHTQHEPSFVFSPRKGIAGITICNDCGKVVLCKNCNKTLTLVENGDSRHFLCTHCGIRERANIICTNCESWNLVPLSYGSEQIAKEIAERIPEECVFILDKEHCSTEKQVHEVIEKWKNADGGILIGTEMALYYFTDAVPLVIIGSLDTALAIPSLATTDRVLLLYNALALRTERKLLIQTRKTTDPILKAIHSGNVSDAIKDELVLRKTLGYPPFSELIKFSARGNKASVNAWVQSINDLLLNYSPMLVPSSVRKTKAVAAASILIRIPKESWSVTNKFDARINDLDLLARLRFLSPQTHITVHPDSVL